MVKVCGGCVLGSWLVGGTGDVWSRRGHRRVCSLGVWWTCFLGYLGIVLALWLVVEGDVLGFKAG